MKQAGYLVALSLAVTSCGGGDSSSTDTAASTATSTTTATGTSGPIDGTYESSTYSCDSDPTQHSIAFNDDPFYHELIIANTSMTLMGVNNVCGLDKAGLVKTETYSVTYESGTLALTPLYYYDYYSASDCTDGGRQVDEQGSFTAPYGSLAHGVQITFPKGTWQACSSTITFYYFKS